MKLAITGADLLTSVGRGRDANFAALCAGTTGNKPLLNLDPIHFRVHRAYEVDDSEQRRPDGKGRATGWLRACISGAIREAGLPLDGGRVALLIGTGLRELRSLEHWWVDGASMHVSELHFSGALHREFGLKGPAFTFSNACSASNFALGVGADMIALGEADAVIVAGCDSITESMFGLLDRVNPAPPERLQPFDRDRKGVLMGEGAAAVVLESAERARARGKTPLGWLRGVGMTCDAYHETAPDLGGIKAAMTDAHARAAVTPEDIDLMLVHGTGTVRNDQVEALAIQEVFGPGAGRILITAIKSMTGHTSGASGLVGVIVAMEAISQGQVPPTIGISARMPEAEGMDVVMGAARSAKLRIAQVNAFGFGGVNAVAIVEGGPDERR